MDYKGHAVIPSASILPKEDPTLLFVNSGMYPLVPYLMGQTHPLGSRIADSQKCIRTLDIEEVGDNRHLSFFEMLGSWSLGDYSKDESIMWGFEFLTSEKWLNLNPQRLYVTVYKGSEFALPDTESIESWQRAFRSVGIEPDVGIEFNFDKDDKTDKQYIYRITQKSGKDNWWGLPYKGPCGPCSEIYYLQKRNPIDFRKNLFQKYNLQQIQEFLENEIVEIWNHVFMEYEGEWGENHEPRNLTPLKNRNVDTGMGFERLLTVINDLETVHQTDVLQPISEIVKRWQDKQ